MELKTGAAESTLDDKGRVNIPTRFRDQFHGKLVITWGIERCAWIMTIPVWEHFEKTLRDAAKFTPEQLFILEEKHINQARVVEMDKAGRIPIDTIIRDYAKLNKDCRVIKSEDRLSIWDAPTYYAYLAEKDQIAREAMNKLGQNLFRMA